MTNKIIDKTHITLLIGVCWILYFASYLTRLSYGASIVEITTAKGIHKTAAGLISTYGFISYGVGQIFSGFLGDRFNSRLVIFFGIAVTSVINLLFPFLPGIGAMSAAWVINGFAQAMLWPPLLKTLSVYLKRESFTKACLHISASSSAGSIAIYLLAPLFVSKMNWQALFLFTGIFGAAITVLWNFAMKYIENHAAKFGEEEDTDFTNGGQQQYKSLKSLFIASGLVPIVLAIVFQGILKDGVTTWMPSYISEVYNMGNAASILATVVLPIFSIISVNIAAALNRNIFKNEVVCAAYMFAAGLVSAAVLIPISALGAAFAVFAAALLTGCMHGVNLMLISALPARFMHYGKVSTITGILNAFTYLGSAISTYFIAAIAEKLGWGAAVASWAMVAAAGTIAVFAAIKKWNMFIAKEG